MPTFDLCKAIPEGVLAQQDLTATVTMPWKVEDLRIDGNGCILYRPADREHSFGFYVTDRNVEYLRAVSSGLPFQELKIDNRSTGVVGPNKYHECTVLADLSSGGGILLTGRFADGPCEKVTDLANTLFPLVPR